MTVALESDCLGRRYRTKWGLRNCTLSVEQGTITGLVGPNGAGKSTLLRLAAGISRPTTGSVSVFGDVVAPNSAAHRDRVGYFDQLRPLYSGFRVEEMLTFGRRLNANWDDLAARKWLDDLDIPTKSRVKNLSLGQQAQVSLAVCMAKRPELLLLDEPVASLDPLARRQLLQALMGAAVDRGTTVLLSSHIVSELEPLCDNLIILSSSEVQLAGTVESILASHRLLVGTRGTPLPAGIAAISLEEMGRQVTAVVRGAAPWSGDGWQDSQPTLDEVVLAYLGKRPSAAFGASAGAVAAVGNPEGIQSEKAPEDGGVA